MFGLLAALITKLAGVGIAAKAAVATTAALAMAVTGGVVAGIVPMPGGNGDAGSIAQPAAEQATDAVSSATDSLPPTTAGETEAEADSEVSVAPATSSTSAGANSGLNTTTDNSSADLPAVPAIPAVPELPALPTCVTEIIPTGGTVPDSAQLVAQLPACIVSVVTENLPLDVIESAIGSANLPIDVSACLSSVVSSISGFAGGDLSALTQLLSACLPTGSLPGMGTGQMPDGSSTPGGFPFPVADWSESFRPAR